VAGQPPFVPAQVRTIRPLPWRVTVKVSLVALELGEDTALLRWRRV
jgi:hypothetical protein